MNLSALPCGSIDWTDVPRTAHSGETGEGGATVFIVD